MHLTLPLLLLAASTGTGTAAAASEPEAPADELRADDFFSSSDFMDSRVTFALSNVNLFAGPGDRATPTSGYRIGVDDDFNLFLENVNTRFSGFESLSHLVLYKKLPAFFHLMETEAALAALVLADTDSGQFRFFDSGTYLRVIRKLGEGDERDVGAFDITAWPVSADRFRLGYTFIISWGGTAIFPGKLQSSSITEGAVPGVRFRYRAPGGKAYAFAGFKSALLLSREPGDEAGEQVPNYGVLTGGGVDLGNVIIEANGGYFQKGTQERPGLEGQSIDAYGASTRITVYGGIAPAQSADFSLYRQDPNQQDRYLLYKRRKTDTGFSVAAELTYLAQNLEDPDNFGSEEVVSAMAAGLVGQYRRGSLKLRLDGFFQSSNFILFNVPGFVPFQATPDGSSTTPELFGALTGSYFFESLRFEPSLSVGIKLPATYEGEVLTGQGAIGGAAIGETRVQVIVDETTRVVLPPAIDATPIVGGLLKLPFYLSPSTVLAGEVRAEINDNQPRIAQDTERGEIIYAFDDPLRLSLALILQSRF